MPILTNIVFVTTSNLSTNPRLIKEVELAISLKFKITIVCFYFRNWSEPFHKELKERFKNYVNLVEISAERLPLFPWLLSSFLQLFCLLLVRLGFRSIFILSQSLHKRSILLQNALSNLKVKTDYVIAHNPGSFYPSMQFAINQKARLGFDIEDYHPGETNNLIFQNSTLSLLQSVLPKANYCSYASPLIASETKKNIFNLANSQVVILNCFSKNDFIMPQHVDDGKLRLVWFSQNIDKGRGLENIIPVINENYPIVELHLVGSLNENFNKLYLANKSGIVIHKPMPQLSLHRFLSNFDVGLATDIPITLNRDIALTNKMLAYVQAGLYIIAMHTGAHDLFLKESELEYIQVDNTFTSIEHAILHAYDLKISKRMDKERQYLIGRNYSWENSSNSLSEVWLS